MKYGKRIIREAIDEFPYDQGASRMNLFLTIKKICPSREGIFGICDKWRIKIHFTLRYIKISYFPNWPSRKGRIYFRKVKDGE